MTTETRRIDGITIGKRHRKEMGDIPGLARSITTSGLLHPIVITPDGSLIAGARRVAAYRHLGRTEIPVTVVDVADVLRAEYAENADRQDFTPSEQVAIYREIAPVVATPVGRPEKPEPEMVESFHHSSDSDKGKTRDKVAAFTGTSGRSLEKAAAVVAAAESEPGKYGPLVAEMDRTGKVNGAHKKLKRLQHAEEIAQELPPLPTGPFRVLVVDPPWAYTKRPDDVTHRASLPYPPMSIEEITALPVADMATEDAVLWLWTTNAHMPHAFTILAAWGFEHKTILTWVKDRMGTGDWLRGQTEHCIMAVRGKPLVLLTNQTTVLHGPLREHSRKPEEFYALVESLCPGSKVELFARTPREGWEAHGSQTNLYAVA